MYQVSDAELIFKVDQFSITPEDALGLVTVEYVVTLDDGSELPEFVSFSVERGLVVFTIYANTNTYTVGAYSIMVLAVAKLGDKTTSKSVTFGLEVL